LARKKLDIIHCVVLDVTEYYEKVVTDTMRIHLCSVLLNNTGFSGRFTGDIRILNLSQIGHLYNVTVDLAQAALWRRSIYNSVETAE